MLEFKKTMIFLYYYHFDYNTFYKEYNTIKTCIFIIRKTYGYVISNIQLNINGFINPLNQIDVDFVLIEKSYLNLVMY